MPYPPYSTTGRLVLHQDLGSQSDTGNRRIRMSAGKVAEGVRFEARRSEARSARMLNSRGYDAMTACPRLASRMIAKSRVTTGLQARRLLTWIPDRI